MSSLSRLMTSAAAVGGLVFLFASSDLRADPAGPPPEPTGRVAAFSPGSIQGVVQDEKGVPVRGAVVTVLGATTTFVVTDGSGRFALRTLSPGTYLVRAHFKGFITSQGSIVEVRPNSRASSSIELRHAMTSSSTVPVLAAGIGAPEAEPPAADAPATVPDAAGGATSGHDDHGEIAWRLRHLRRGILQDVTVPDDLVTDDSPTPDTTRFGPGAGFFGSPARMATSFFSGTPFSGQFNLLTAGSLGTAQQLLSSDNFASSVAYISVGAPAGSGADWAVRSAISQADISSWVVAGVYSTRGPARHHYDSGLWYSTQRYDGGNPAALRDPTDGSRNAGEMYGFDTFTITPGVAVTYGARYARYDYLEGKSLISPRLQLTLSPAEHVRINTLVSRRAVAPGAEEFQPPDDSGIWLPPQRTFSPLSSDRPLEAEQTTHFEVELERDFGSASVVSVRAFEQRVANQLVTMFDVDVPGLLSANLGHYFVGNYGDVGAGGLSAAFRTHIAGRVRGSVAYTLTHTQWAPGDALAYWLVQLPSLSPLRSDQIQDLTTTLEGDIPETSTRIVVLYRLSTAFARGASDEGLLDSRFDVQLHQSLPFLDFSSARWEMLLGVRNFFRDAAAGQSVYDELLVVHPPKRIVGGLTMRF
jgi:Carboxypeptidase regulatory-like domain